VFVHGLSLMGALWPSIGELASTPGGVSINGVGGVNGVDGGGWLESRVGAASSSSEGADSPPGTRSSSSGGTDPRTALCQQLPVALLACALADEDGDEESAVGGEDGDEFAASQRWRVEQRLPSSSASKTSSDSASKGISVRSGDGEDGSEHDNGELVQSPAVPLSPGGTPMAKRSLPLMQPLCVPVYCASDRKDLLFECTFPAALNNPQRDGSAGVSSAPWPLASVAIVLHDCE
jgi:hypothetical protein